MKTILFILSLLFAQSLLAQSEIKTIIDSVNKDIQHEVIYYFPNTPKEALFKKVLNALPKALGSSEYKIQLIDQENYTIFITGVFGEVAFRKRPFRSLLDTCIVNYALQIQIKDDKIKIVGDHYVCNFHDFGDPNFSTNRFTSIIYRTAFEFYSWNNEGANSEIKHRKILLNSLQVNYDQIASGIKKGIENYNKDNTW